jgi:hypothetical protein
VAVAEALEQPMAEPPEEVAICSGPGGYVLPRPRPRTPTTKSLQPQALPPLSCLKPPGKLDLDRDEAQGLATALALVSAVCLRYRSLRED